MQPLEKLLLKLKREGTRLPSWMIPLGNEVIVYDGISYARSPVLAKLRKDAGEDEEDDSDEQDDTDDSGDDAGSSNLYTASQEAGDIDFDTKHHAGLPVCRITGEENLRRKDGGAASTASDPASISANDIRSAIADGMNGPSQLPQGTQVASDDGTPGNNQAQNRQVDAVVKILGLNKDQRQKLHRRISGQNLGFQGVLKEGRDMLDE